MTQNIPARRKLDESEIVVLIAIVILVSILIVVLARSAASDSSAATPEDPIQSVAIEEAEAMVISEIISPATANFSPDTETGVVKRRGNQFEVTGWVDAQNAHGALIRQRYKARLKYDQTRDTWVHHNLDLTAWSDK